MFESTIHVSIAAARCGIIAAARCGISTRFALLVGLFFCLRLSAASTCNVHQALIGPSGGMLYQWLASFFPQARELKPVDILFLNFSVQASITSLLLVLPRYWSTDLATSWHSQGTLCLIQGGRA